MHTAEFWNEKYESEQTGWDLGVPSPPLIKYFDGLEDKTISILIPGAGNAYEAEYLLERGFTNLTVVDIAPLAVKNLQDRLCEKMRGSIEIIHGNFFALTGKYDLIVEQTFFCALPTGFREKYVEKMHDLLSEEGRLAGLLFDREFEEGPPYGGSRKEYLTLFEKKFHVYMMEPCYNSAAPRQGSELFFIAGKIL